LADTFTSTVDSTVSTFNVLYEVSGGSRSVRGQGSISVRLLPYGPSPSVIVQSAGGMALVRTLRLYFASLTQLNNLFHCRGHHGTLSTTETGSIDVTLESVDDNWIATDLAINEAVATFVADTL
jgi:hypothetical protein